MIHHKSSTKAAIYRRYRTKFSFEANAPSFSDAVLNLMVRPRIGPHPMIAAASMTIKNGVSCWYTKDIEDGENVNPVNIVPIKPSA